MEVHQLLFFTPLIQNDNRLVSSNPRPSVKIKTDQNGRTDVMEGSHFTRRFQNKRMNVPKGYHRQPPTILTRYNKRKKKILPFDHSAIYFYSTSTISNVKA
jgi:hypothetical protein